MELCALLITLIMAYCTEYFVSWDAGNQGEKNLARVMAELDKKEPGWRYESVFLGRNRRLASPDKNSAEIAAAVVRKLPSELVEWCSSLTLDVGIPPNELIPPKQIQLYRSKLKPHSKSLEALTSLARPLPNSGFPVLLAEPNPLDTSLSKLVDHRPVSKLLSLQARIALADCDSSLPIEYCRAIIGASNSLGDEPLMISQIIKLNQCNEAIITTERALGCGNPKVGLELLQAEMLATTRNRYLAEGIKGDRLSFLRLFASMYDGKCKLPDLDEKNIVEKCLDQFAWQLHRGYVPNQQMKWLELCTEILAATEKPYPARTEAINAILNELLALHPVKMKLVRLLFPALNKIEIAEQRVKTRLATAAVAIACERFRLQNQRWPKDLNEIPKSILKEIPTDLFTGKPLLMKRTKTGLVIYSTGVDGIDNGGEKLDNQMPPGTDIGFRLYDPEHRRQLHREMPD